MNILVTYATTTGNTERVAKKLHEYLESNYPNHSVSLIDMLDLNPNDLTKFDFVIMGSSTWGEGEFNDTAQDFFDQLREADIELLNVSFAIFGLGDTVYETFCNVVDLMADEVKKKKGKVIGTALKIDKFPDEEKLGMATTWLQQIVDE